MATTLKPQLSAYANCKVTLTSKHQKVQAIGPHFLNTLAANVHELTLDTDTLGTFSGEVLRSKDALSTVKKKCLWGLNTHGGDYGLASEGSFGPHPQIPWLAADHEILYFIDNKRGFHLYESYVFPETNYLSTTIDREAELLPLADKALFPSHALILASQEKKPSMLFKGLQSQEDLLQAFHEIRQQFSGPVHVQTDMRAHMNPTRMRMIASLADKLARRLNCLCPNCHCPGWGPVALENGLPCACCGQATRVQRATHYGCNQCAYQQTFAVKASHADPGRCSHCNP